MADNKSIATRDSYGAALLELADAGHDDIVVFDADLSASTRTSVFAKKYSERFFDCGIAECNMIGVAGGLSTIGYTVFASSFAMFAAGRAFEQIRNTVGYPHLNVKIGATHAGISVGEDGASHQCCEDIALMRTIPGMVIINPADDVEARAAVFAAAEQIKRNIAFRRRFVYHLTHTSCPFHSEHPGKRRRCMPFSFLHPQSVRIFCRTASYFPIFRAVQFNKRRSAPMFILIIPQQEKSSRVFS